MLQLKDISVNYGAVQAVRQVSLQLARGQVGALVGANGAGKSSLLKAISGIAALASGTIVIDDVRVDKVPAYRRRSIGVVHVMEGHRVFADQSVEANLRLGALGPLAKKRTADQIAQDIERQFERFPVLAEKRRQLAGTLSGGQQQMLAISAALMSHPQYVLLDEPSLGLAPRLVDEIFELISKLRGEGLTVLLIEQRAARALEIADYGWVMQRGSVVLSGPAKSLADNAELKDAYLGGVSEEAAAASLL